MFECSCTKADTYKCDAMTLDTPQCAYGSLPKDLQKAISFFPMKKNTDLLSLRSLYRKTSHRHSVIHVYM